jgi:hypothetical protein
MTPPAGGRAELTSPPAVPTGNTFDKYGSANPVLRRLVAGFAASAADLIAQAAPASLLDVGCGEGVLTERWAAGLAPGKVVGVDLHDPALAAPWSARAAPPAALHPPADPAAALAEMARVASRWLLVSVPREPLWRLLNLARGAYVPALGNTPGHLQHWSRAGFCRLLAAHGELVAVRAPLPWTMLLVRVG